MVPYFLMLGLVVEFGDPTGLASLSRDRWPL